MEEKAATVTMNDQVLSSDLDRALRSASRLVGRRGVGIGALALVGLLSAGCAQDINRSSGARTELRAQLTGSSLVAPDGGVAKGYLEATYDPATHTLDWQLKWSGLKAFPTHLELLSPVAAEPMSDGRKGVTTLTRDGAALLLAGRVHINVTTAQYPDGEVRGRIHTGSRQQIAGRTTLSAFLTGKGELEHNDSTAKGRFVGIYNPANRQLEWELRETALSGAALVTIFDQYTPWSPIGGNGMTGSMTLTDGQAIDLLAGRWTASLDTHDYPIGEIHGQIVPLKK